MLLERSFATPTPPSLRQEETCIAHTTEAKNAAAADGLEIHDNRKR